MDFHLMNTSEVFNELKTGSDGLSSSEAKSRLQTYGKNEFEKAKKSPLVVRFVKQILDPMIIILLVAAAVSVFVSIVNKESFADMFIILAVVIINAILGVYQESKAEKSIEALRQMTAPTTIVIRNGRCQEVASADLVVGDIVILETGDAVPADGRIVDSKLLQIEESALTGESVPVHKLIDALELSTTKKIDIADRKNMAYMGSTVVYGRGTMVVTTTGMKTEMGKIAGELQNVAKVKTPLQLKMVQLSKVLTWVVVLISVVVFALQLLSAGAFNTEVVISSFMIAISLAVAAIPEGLPAVVTVALSIGVSRMSKRNAIVRKLTAVETLGCAQIICSDKTGTLTQNKMTVTDSFGDESLLKMAMGLCNDATADAGEPTEKALFDWAKIDKSKFKRLAELPFDSKRKMMSTLNEVDGETIQYTKGAPDVILKHCANVDEAKILEANKAMADKALRVLACAYRKADSIEENNMTFIGLVGLIDPVRPEVAKAISQCENAGIKPIMITGDHINTACAIARELKILSDDCNAVSGLQLDDMSDEDFAREFKNISVYARVRPEHKTRIVKAWQNAGYVVAMTGDGVNDAPSIKTADIGVGMGITGTDVTKNVADMVLVDDNFATIVNAVEEGRRIYENIIKSIQYLLSSNIGEVLGVFFASLFGFTLMLPVHLLWVNLVTDCVPALALGLEEKEPNIMSRKPRAKSDGIFADGMAFDLIYQGIIVTALIMLSYFIGVCIDTGAWQITTSAHGISMAFLTMSMVGCFHSLNLRSRRQSIFSLKKQNWILLISVLVSLILTSIVVEVPIIASAFKLTELGLTEWLIAIGLGLAIIPIVELVKLLQRSLISP